MNIYARPGWKVTIANLTMKHCKDSIIRNAVGMILTVKYTEVGQSSSRVTFEEIPGSYNTIDFVDCTDQPRELRIRSGMLDSQFTDQRCPLCRRPSIKNEICKMCDGHPELK